MAASATLKAEPHDPRFDPPTAKDRRRALKWAAFLGFTPICMGVVIWAALDLNGNYPTVSPPVPHGWQAVPGIYASFSVPKGWSLQTAMSDSNGDVYYSGGSGSAGLSVSAAGSPPEPSGVPPIVATYLVDNFRTLAVEPCSIRFAAKAWRYTFAVAGGLSGSGIQAWSKATQSRIWLVVVAPAPTAQRVLSTLTLAS